MFVGQYKHNPLVEVNILSHLLMTTCIIVTLIFLRKSRRLLERFKASVENEFEMKIKALRVDRGGVK